MAWCRSASPQWTLGIMWEVFLLQHLRSMWEMMDSTPEWVVDSTAGNPECEEEVWVRQLNPGGHRSPDQSPPRLFRHPGQSPHPDTTNRDRCSVGGGGDDDVSMSVWDR